MATTLTFDSLIADLESYLERGTSNDSTVENELPRIINRTEREIARRLKILGLLTPLTDTMTAGVSVYTKPDRWRETTSMRFGGGIGLNTSAPLFPRSYEYLRMYWPDATARDVPEFYADYDYSHWLISPTPDQNYPWEVMAYMIPPMLDLTNQQNWVAIYAPDVLLNGCLKNCESMLKDDPRIPVWTAAFESGLNELNGEDLQRIIDRSTSRQEA